MGWITTELVAVSLAAMLSPTTLSVSVLVLVLSERPRRTGWWFFFGAFAATLAVGIVASFFIGDVAASSDKSTPKTWVAIVDVIAALIIVYFVVRWLRRPSDPNAQSSMVERMQRVSSSPAVAVIGAGAALANPGGFIPIALKTISETDPSGASYSLEWLFFTIASLLPLELSIAALVVAPNWTGRVLERAQDWLLSHIRLVSAVIAFLLAAILLRNGIAGLTS